MPQTLLKPNRRAALSAGLLPAVLCGLGLALVAGGLGDVSWIRTIGAILASVAFLTLAVVLWQLMRPRLGYARGCLLVYLSGGRPEPVPIEVVECFFLGEGPGMLGEGEKDAQVSTVIVRLAEAATEFHNRDVLPALGRWHDGYITVRGTWCEPITQHRVEDLNAWLVAAQAAHRQQRQSAANAPSSRPAP